jgi:lysophospholipase L1-like esterase
VITLCVSYAVYCLLEMPAVPFTEPDSAGYLAFAPIHTLGYPLFLKALGAKGAILVQPILFSLSLACLGIETWRATSSIVLSAGVIIASITIPDLTTYHASILTESLFMSGLVMFLAATVRFVRQPSSCTGAWAATIAGLTATVRRTGIAFLPVLPVMVLLQWRRLPSARFAILAASTLPMVALLTGERIAARAIHGENLTSLTGRHLFAKAAMIEAPAALNPSNDPLRVRLDEHLDAGYRPIRDLITRAPQDTRAVLAVFYETCLQWPCVRELRMSMSPLPEQAQNEMMAQVGVERIARAPLNFARLTALQYESLWTAYKLRHPDTTPALNAFIASNRPLPFEREAFAVNREDTLEFQAYRSVRFIQPVVILIGWLTGGLALLGLGAAASRRLLPAAVSIACIASLTAHSGLLLSALLAAGISRFMVSLWPAVMTALLFALAAAGCSSTQPQGPSTVTPAPSIVCPAAPPSVQVSTTQAVVPVSYGSPSVTGGTLPVSTTCTPASGSSFPVGSTAVTCTATDSVRRTASCSFGVIVVFVPPPPRLSVTNFLAFGDSITAGAVPDGTALARFRKLQILPFDRTYPGQLVMMLKARYTTQTQQISVVKDGVQGESTAGGAARLPNELALYQPEVLLLLEGINDLDPLRPSSSMSTALVNLRTMILQARGRNARVMVGTLLPERPGGNDTGAINLIDPFNRDLVAMAMAEGALVVDVHQAFLPHLNDWIGIDGLHPNEAGYQAMAQVFFDAIRGAYEVPGSTSSPTRSIGLRSTRH